MSHTIEEVMQLGELLCATTPLDQSPVDLKNVLTARLQRYQSGAALPIETFENHTLDDLQRQTALAAMKVIDMAQSIYLGRNSEGANAENSPAGIGSRDLRHLRMLLSIVFKWGILPPLSIVEASFPGAGNAKPIGSTGSTIVDLTSLPTEWQFVSALTRRLLLLIYPDGAEGSISPTFITVALLERHVADLLHPCLVLGWIPKLLETPDTPIQHIFRPAIMRLITNLPAVDSIGALGSILQLPSLPQHVRKTCASLLNRQLIRVDGVQGVLISIFGERDESAADAPMEKLEQVSRLLQTVPSRIDPKDYYSVIIPCTLEFLRQGSTPRPDSHIRAAAYCLSHMIADKSFLHRELATGMIVSSIHAPFLQPHNQDIQEAPGNANAIGQLLPPGEALSILIKLVTNTDPSPSLISAVLSPILPALYNIKEPTTRKAVNPSLQESLNGLLTTWGKIVDKVEGIQVLWRVIDGEGGDWDVDIVGNIERSKGDISGPEMFTPESLRAAEAAGDLDVDSNLMNLRPDPVNFVRYLKTVDRLDIASELFVRLLESYRGCKASSKSNPLRTLLYLQLIIQMQTRMTSNDPKSDLLSRADHILAFVKHTLSPEGIGRAPNVSSQVNESLTLNDLHIISEDEQMDEQGDSDDEDEDSNDELMSTAVDLLLAVLESNPRLSAQSTPILNDIFELLEPVTIVQTESLRALAREARMVITARMASSSTIPTNTPGYSTDNEESPQEIYQKALKLLQDPILPVRAHGLLLLREIVSPKLTSSGSLDKPQAVNEALVPAILSIFLQALQDEDSYIYLNAVQGLSSMVNTRGKDVLKGLLNAYCVDAEVTGSAQFTVAQLDVRLRVGEALSQIIRRCGSALGNYSDLLVPALFRIVRASHLPAALRSSSLSLLAQCANTYSLALLPFSNDLIEGAVDLLQTGTRGSSKVDEEVDLDDQPTSPNTKAASLHRSAIHLVSLLLRSYTQSIYEFGSIKLDIDDDTLRRLGLTLRYVAATDSNGMVKMMAREASELAESYKKAKLGI